MPNENLKKVAILGLCVFFMVGLGACQAIINAIQIAIYLMWFCGFITLTIFLYYITRYIAEKLSCRPNVITYLPIVTASIPLLLCLGYYYKQKIVPRIEKASNQRKYNNKLKEDEKVADFWREKMIEYKTNLNQACQNEQKLIINQKIPANTGIFARNTEFQVVMGMMAANYFSADPTVPFVTTSDTIVKQCTTTLRKQKNLPYKIDFEAGSVCYFQYTIPIAWAYDDFFNDVELVKLTKTSYIESLQKKQLFRNTQGRITPINEVTAPYELLISDISTIDDRNKGIRRGRLQITNLETREIMSEYTSFDMVPINNNSLYNCSNLQEDPKTKALDKAYDSKNIYRYFFAQAVE